MRFVLIAALLAGPDAISVKFGTASQRIAELAEHSEANHPQGVTTMTTTFQVGKSYATRSICDHECIFRFTILSRTAKSVTVNVHGKIVRRGLSIWNGVEQFKPFGNYSMCAIIGADDWELAA